MKKAGILLVILLALFVVGCTTHIHTIGNGPQTGEMIQARQWYILFGLVPLNEVDTHEMAGDAADYEIKTETSAIDILIGIPASYVTVSSRTVTVTK
ncbi:MAG: hypothetical protein GXO91_06665 [FCB group bacterium]|nr:hypothetical protein [FCB group bacterium]